MKRTKNVFIFFAVFLALCKNQPVHAFKIDRVIISSDNNPIYLDFWPLAAKAWKNIVGIQPTLALVADKSVIVDETIGDVMRFEPIPTIPTSLYAQAIRLLVPIYFENEVCLIADIDMLPLSKNYFLDLVAHINKDCFVVYRDQAYGNGSKRYPMCYNAAQGNIFKDIFNIKSVNDIPSVIQQWAQLGHGWSTDEILLYTSLNTWHKKTGKCVLLGGDVHHRVDRGDWRYDPTLVKEHHYIDTHLLRPYAQHKDEIDKLAKIAGIIP